MKLIEVAVNVPIRRTFGRSAHPPPPDDDYVGENTGEAAEDGNLQTFHYHLPPDLESTVEPGHLVWVPFGPQKLQGVVLRTSDYSPVPTKAILRLARPEPVLTPVQIRLAEWIAAQYVAPLAEAIKLGAPQNYESLWRQEYGRGLLAASGMLRRVERNVGAYELAFQLAMAMSLSDPSQAV